MQKRVNTPLDTARPERRPRNLRGLVRRGYIQYNTHIAAAVVWPPQEVYCGVSGLSANPSIALSPRQGM
ncbi:hypothetical protein E2C01_084776 [Portunus trituberculatus]|uniref:Uncharacterized protein n=1 Tax=Portunus trituberculatus TaxID=210409 RepID=A0A5B7J748_PORTR|nr:hypothetical protein [Portunus trituberculatus]